MLSEEIVGDILRRFYDVTLTSMDTQRGYDDFTAIVTYKSLDSDSECGISGIIKILGEDSSSKSEYQLYIGK